MGARMIEEMSSHYKPPELALLLHALPHLNVSLHLVNSTFAPDSELYLESLGILGSIPAAWLILTLFLLLVYLMTRCCDRKPRPKHSIVVLKWTLAIFAVLCCGAIGVSLYGNDDLHNGLLGFIAAARAVDEKISLIKNQTRTMELALNVTMERVSGELREVLDGAVQNQTALAELLVSFRQFTSRREDAFKALRDIGRSLKYITLHKIIDDVQLGESLRWPITMGVLCLLLVFCIVLLFGVARHSRYALIMFSVVGLFAVIISWLLSSIYLATAVATGDLCVNPDAFVEQRAPRPLQADMVAYYVACEAKASNPFIALHRDGTRAIDDMKAHLAAVTHAANDLYRDKASHHLDALANEVYRAADLVATLATHLDCNFFRAKYLDVLRSVCKDGLFGLALMLVASLVSGFFFTILVWLDSHTWIYIRKKQHYGRGLTGEQDPLFLPPSAAAASQAIAARTLRNQGREVSSSNGAGVGMLHGSGMHSIGTISQQRVGGEAGVAQYATLNRKFRTLDHPSRQAGRHVVSFDTAMSSHTLGHHHGKKRNDAPHYSTLSKKCKTLEANDFY